MAKFRAWHQLANRFMVYEIGCIMYGPRLKMYNELCNDSAKWFQSSGCKDKNGKEIWEGDKCIIQVTGNKYEAFLTLNTNNFKFRVEYNLGYKKIYKYYAIPNRKYIEVI